MDKYLQEVLLNNDSQIINTNKVNEVINNFNNYNNTCVLKTYFDLKDFAYDLDNSESISVATITKQYVNIKIVLSLLHLLNKEDIFNKETIKHQVFLSRINNIFVKENGKRIDNFDDLENELNKSLNYYEEQYYQVLKTGQFSKDLSDLNIIYVDVEKFLHYIKGLTSYEKFCLVVDGDSLCYLETKAINNLINSKDNILCVKVCCSKEYPLEDFNGKLVSFGDVSKVSIVDKNYVRVLK